MQKVFQIKEICPFFLLKLSKDEFYNFLDEEYKRIFGIEINIIDIKLDFIKDGLKIKIYKYS